MNETIQDKTDDGALAVAIQRKTAEIDSWPAWAKPYEHQGPSTPPANETPPRHHTRDS